MYICQELIYKNMKKYLKELLISVIQLLLFYVFPLFSGPTDTMGMVVIMIFTTFVLSVLITSISKNKIKYFYPIITVLIFIPSVFIYYNNSALIHSLWYFVVSMIGIGIGTIIYKINNK